MASRLAVNWDSKHAARTLSREGGGYDGEVRGIGCRGSGTRAHPDSVPGRAVDCVFDAQPEEGGESEGGLGWMSFGDSGRSAGVETGLKGRGRFRDGVGEG